MYAIHYNKFGGYPFKLTHRICTDQATREVLGDSLQGEAGKDLLAAAARRVPAGEAVLSDISAAHIHWI